MIRSSTEWIIQEGGIYKDSRDSRSSSATDYFKKPFQPHRSTVADSAVMDRHDDRDHRSSQRDSSRDEKSSRSTWDVTPTSRSSRHGGSSARGSSSHRSDASPFRRPSSSSSSSRSHGGSTLARSSHRGAASRQHTQLPRPDTFDPDRPDATAYNREQQDLDREWYMFEEGNAMANDDSAYHNLFAQDQAHWEKKEKDFQAQQMVCLSAQFFFISSFIIQRRMTAKQKQYAMQDDLWERNRMLVSGLVQR